MQVVDLTVTLCAGSFAGTLGDAIRKRVFGSDMSVSERRSSAS